MATLRGERVDRLAVNLYEIGGLMMKPNDPDGFDVYNDPSWKPLIGRIRKDAKMFYLPRDEDVLWTKAGADRLLRLVVIAPVGYRLRKGSKLLYRKPAYLICTDPDMPMEEILQYYIWR